jgi:hypothetical protein
MVIGPTCNHSLSHKTVHGILEKPHTQRVLPSAGTFSPAGSRSGHAFVTTSLVVYGSGARQQTPAKQTLHNHLIPDNNLSIIEMRHHGISEPLH